MQLDQKIRRYAAREEVDIVRMKQAQLRRASQGRVRRIEDTAVLRAVQSSPGMHLMDVLFVLRTRIYKNIVCSEQGFCS